LFGQRNRANIGDQKTNDTRNCLGKKKQKTRRRNTNKKKGNAKKKFFAP